MKKITYDDTRDCAIRIIEGLAELGILNKDIFGHEDYFSIQDMITEEYNEILGLDIDNNFEIQIL